MRHPLHTSQSKEGGGLWLRPPWRTESLEEGNVDVHPFGGYSLLEQHSTAQTSSTAKSSLVWAARSSTSLRQGQHHTVPHRKGNALGTRLLREMHGQAFFVLLAHMGRAGRTFGSASAPTVVHCNAMHSRSRDFYLFEALLLSSIARKGSSHESYSQSPSLPVSFPPPELLLSFWSMHRSNGSHLDAQPASQPASQPWFINSPRHRFRAVHSLWCRYPRGSHY